MARILITGSTDGIGKLAAQKLLKDGHEVILHGRNSEKLADCLKEFEKENPFHKPNGFIADLSNLESVKHFCLELKEKYESIDVLINNAGVYHTTETFNNQGLDLRFVVNYLAPYLITKQTLPLLKKGKLKRVINLSSAAQASISIPALKGEAQLSAQAAYAQSKLALLMWSFGFSKTEKEIDTIALNPGSLLNTKMVKEAFGHHWSPADKGAQIIADLSTSKDFNGRSGQYFDNDVEDFNRAHEDAYQQTIIEELEKETQKLMAKHL